LPVKKDRKNWTVRKLTFAEAQEADIMYWAEKSIKERVSEATAWIENVCAFGAKMHGEFNSLPDGKHNKKLIDEDDF